MMSRVRDKHTRPELAVRRLVHGMGFRYRLHQRGLPGKPDLVFRRIRKVIFVHGCFWHQHPHCPKSKLPSTRPDFWTDKLRGNRKRDLAHIRALRAAAWGVLVLWECQLSRPAVVRAKVKRFLTSTAACRTQRLVAT